MRILWIKTELLHPVDKGGRIRTYQMLRSLARQHHVTYLALDDGQAAPDALQRAHEYCSDVVTVPFKPTTKMSPAFFVDLLRNLLSTLPYAIARYRSSAMRERIEQLSRNMDLVICDFLAPSVNVPDKLPIPTVLFQHNVEAMIWERHAAVPQNPIRRAYMHRQWQRMRNFEANECLRFNHVVAVSEVDARIMQSQYKVSSVSDVPTGVDLEYFTARQARPTNNSELVFVGSMDWMPNDDGIRWFAAEVFQKIRDEVPDAKLTVVGRSPSAAMRELAIRISGIEVTGTVPDVRPYLERAAISIVPLRVGGGTRLKIYEAMAMGTPMVSTTIGAEGLPIQDGEHLSIADAPDKLANAIIHLLRHPAEAERLAANALRHVQQHCSWDAVANQFLSQCLDRRNTRTLSHKDLPA